MLSEKSQWTQNGTMFVDLDWPLNASSPLSASAELLVTLRAKLSGAVYCYRSCLWRAAYVRGCEFVGLLPR